MFEVLIVMGIFVLVGGFALFVSMETYRGTNFRSDRSVLIAALERARAQSVNNVCLGTGCTNGKPHGVKMLTNNTLVLFQGASYAARDTDVDSVFRMDTATTTGASEFVFSQLAGTSTPAEIVLTEQTGRVSTTTISSEGQITWTN